MLSISASPYNEKQSVIHLPSIVPKAETISSSGEYGVAHLFSPHSPPDQTTPLGGAHGAIEATAVSEPKNSDIVTEMDTEQQMDVEEAEGSTLLKSNCHINY